MPSFDIVSEVDMQEIDNAVNQAAKEILQRFDFRGTSAKIELDRTTKIINLIANSENKIDNIVTVLYSKAAKRNIDLKAFDQGKTVHHTGDLHKCIVKIVEGIEKEKAKKIVKHIKDLKMKVQAAIHEEKVRVTGKKRDDLQEAMTAIKAHNFEVPLQFENFRD